MKNAFLAAIHSKSKVLLAFRSKKDGQILVRKCAPLDYGPIRNSKDMEDRFHFWDYDSDQGPHPLPLKPEQILSMRVLPETFHPRSIITWDPEWFVERNW